MPHKTEIAKADDKNCHQYKLKIIHKIDSRLTFFRAIAAGMCTNVKLDCQKRMLKWMNLQFNLSVAHILEM